MTRTFHKMHGLGNDFVIFDAREELLAIDEAFARAISDRKTGVGCDQLILLEKSNLADLRMRIWNHDGIEVESCGNASRCVVALTHAGTIETGGGLVTGTEDGSDVEVSLGEPHFEWERVPVTYPMPTNPIPAPERPWTKVCCSVSMVPPVPPAKMWSSFTSMAAARLWMP